MRNDPRCEALTFASNYLASVELDCAPSYRGGCMPRHSIDEELKQTAIVDATVMLSSAPARITLTIPYDWRIRTPCVQCHESWFRRGNLDWHSFSDAGLCYIHWQEWRDSLGVIEQECGEAALLPLGASLCAQLSMQLMERHLLAHRLKLRTWPNEWLSWSHGKKGTEEYRAEKNQRLSALARAYRTSPVAMPK